jgi:hypothetical protein
MEIRVKKILAVLLIISMFTEVYYAIDERAPAKFYTFAEAPGSFTGTIPIPEDLAPGTHSISIYAQDRDGAISNAIQKSFTVLSGPTLTGHDLAYAAGQGPAFLDPNFTVDYSGTITGGKVYIDFNFDSATDSLSFTNGYGITGSYNASSGVLSLSGAASAADYQAFIRNIKFNSTATSGSRKIVVILTTGAGDVYYYSGTGHYYEYVAAKNIRWTEAKDAAEARSYRGLTGYLATITSAGENDFVAGKCEGNGWLGGSDAGHDKQWYWVTGPEAGSKFCQQKSYPPGVGVEYTVGGWYQNFDDGEPNDYPSGRNEENYLHMYPNGKWNDYPDYTDKIFGYLVEYGTEYHTPEESSIAVINVAFIDETPPTINSISGNPTSWTNEDVTLTVSASDAGSGLHSGGAYSFNYGEWTTSPSQTFTSNQTVNIRVRDNSGNIASQDVVIDKIDKNAPTFTNITHNPASWTSGPVTLTVNGLSDNGEAGLHEEPYSFSTAEGEYNWQSSATSLRRSSLKTRPFMYMCGTSLAISARLPLS